MSRIGFIGMGNMAQAIAAGFFQAGKVEKDQVLAYAPHKDKLLENAERIGFVPIHDLIELVVKSDILIMACKPYQIEGVLADAGAYMKGKALISIAAGWTFANYEKFLGADVRIQCIMPNTPAMVGSFLKRRIRCLQENGNWCWIFFRRWGLQRSCRPD